MTLKINIGTELLTKLNILSSNYNIELGGYLMGEVKQGEIHLQDLLIPSQQITSASVHINPQDQIDLLKRYGDKVKKIIGHWHSHHSLSCFWSGTDTNNMSQIMQYKDFFIFIVSSKGNHLIKVMQRKPYHLDIDDAKLNIKTVGIELMKKFVDNLMKNNNANFKQTDYFVGDKEQDNENYNKYKEEVEEEKDLSDGVYN